MTNIMLKDQNMDQEGHVKKNLVLLDSFIDIIDNVQNMALVSLR